MNHKKIIARVMRLTQIAGSDKGKDRIHKDIEKKLGIAKGARALLDKIKLLYQYYKDPATSKSKKVIIGAGLLYFIIPTDVINDFIPILGYVDDGVAIAYVWSLVERELSIYQQNHEMIDVSVKQISIDDKNNTN